MGLYIVNGKVFSAAHVQWAPTLTFHDPNPPITLEDTSVSVHIEATEAGPDTFIGTGNSAVELFVSMAASEAAQQDIFAASDIIEETPQPPTPPADAFPDYGFGSGSSAEYWYRSRRERRAYKGRKRREDALEEALDLVDSEAKTAASADAAKAAVREAFTDEHAFPAVDFRREFDKSTLAEVAFLISEAIRQAKDEEEAAVLLLLNS